VIRNKRISVIIPCRNEGSHIAEVVKKIPKTIDEIIVVSNKSTDNTVEEASRIGGRVKVFEDNRSLNGIGYGFAHITGIKKATGDLIVAMDGDATYPIEDISEIVDYLLNNELDFVSCNRYPLKDNTKVPLMLKLGVGMLNIETRILYGVSIKDILSGMWIFKKSIKKDLALTMGDWNLSPQIKINAATNPNIKFDEFNIVQHTREGDTKQNYLSTGFSHATWILKNRFKRDKN
jgi:glycosyltransferase involved in cell wall biosynthesis